MPILTSQISPKDPNFKRNVAAYSALRATIDDIRKQSTRCGSDRAIALHRERGKLLARERIHGLLDPGAAFLEVGQTAGHGLYADTVPSAALVTGIGLVSGRLCMIMANDA
ncbi:carboxyl transferase domain-containing protein, partial [Rhizobiaceae sp. 2RAB30]